MRCTAAHGVDGPDHCLGQVGGRIDQMPVGLRNVISSTLGCVAEITYLRAGMSSCVARMPNLRAVDGPIRTKMPGEWR